MPTSLCSVSALNSTCLLDWETGHPNHHPAHWLHPFLRFLFDSPSVNRWNTYCKRIKRNCIRICRSILMARRLPDMHCNNRCLKISHTYYIGVGLLSSTNRNQWYVMYVEYCGGDQCFTRSALYTGIGVTEGINQDELKSMVSEPISTHFFTVDDFNQLIGVLENVILGTCAKQTTPAARE